MYQVTINEYRNDKRGQREVVYNRPGCRTILMIIRSVFRTRTGGELTYIKR